MQDDFENNCITILCAYASFGLVGGQIPRWPNAQGEEVLRSPAKRLPHSKRLGSTTIYRAMLAELGINATRHLFKQTARPKSAHLVRISLILLKVSRYDRHRLSTLSAVEQQIRCWARLPMLPGCARTD